MYLSKKNWEDLVEEIVKAGDYAAEKQKSVIRNFKPDGSVLTKTDTKLDRILTEAIEKLFPASRIVSEENPVNIAESSKWTFTLDPIDGTDSYSQNMPGWCVAVGVLDEDMNPSGAIVYAPAWGSIGGTLINLPPGGELSINKEIYKSGPENEEESRKPFQVMAGSKIHRHFDYSGFPGKIRTTGSGVLNIIGQVLHSAVKGTVLTPCYIWDLAAAHAVIKKAGYSMEYLDGREIDYKYLAEREKAEYYLVAGSEFSLSEIRKFFKVSPHTS